MSDYLISLLLIPFSIFAQEATVVDSAYYSPDAKLSVEYFNVTSADSVDVYMQLYSRQSNIGAAKVKNDTHDGCVSYSRYRAEKRKITLILGSVILSMAAVIAWCMVRIYNADKFSAKPPNCN